MSNHTITDPITEKIYDIAYETSCKFKDLDDYDRLKETERVLIWENFDRIMNIVNDMSKGMKVDENIIMDILQEAIVECCKKEAM